MADAIRRMVVGELVRNARKACLIGLIVPAIIAVWLGGRAWQKAEGYLRPHEIESLAELYDFTGLQLPPGTVLIAARQQATPGENQTWAVVEMPAAKARMWLQGPLFAEPPTGDPDRSTLQWLDCPASWHWEPWHPQTARRVLLNGGVGMALADLDQPGRARVYIYWPAHRPAGRYPS